MRIVNKFFSGLLMIMTASVCSNLSANQNAAIEENQLPVYSNNLAGISLDFEDRLLTGLIETDSGLVFRIVDYKNRDDNVLKTWQAGDVLSIKSSIDHDVLVFDIKRTNVEDSDEVEVVAVLDVTKESPAALHITKIIEDGEVIQLSDGSAWTFGYSKIPPRSGA